ncbi:hypothetical protein [Symbiobacterium thermophilum]|uniref:Uncharacterized protein n=1 Tax=Symbiobacterium thermophilum (strain DSM 24528 / JCM 14929 / IAM 14863 / T) TaxID=292459 RepID=Q67K45_SYMTH|nr:hypothetical protein [Symbiobacterium thermophilum]BAD41953.1 conserved hypothetical protein [Symbiobacterium thermophilum IAM 14863]
MDKLIGIILVLVGLAALFRITLSGAWLFLLIAAALALAVKSGWLGRGAYVAAVVFVLLAVAGLAARTVIFGLAMLFRLAPLILLALGIYYVYKAFVR